MKLTGIQVAVGSAALLVTFQPCLATASHRHVHLNKRHGHATHHSTREAGDVEKRGGTCAFPTDAGLVAITPSMKNGGWALSPDQECLTGSYCPYACPPGEVMAQWKPNSDYSTSDRMAGGLYCDYDGKAKKPFEDEPYCVQGTGTVQAVNKAGKVCSFCQTVLPGNEDIIIPTDVYGTQTLAVPDPSYWDSTAAHYYINAPGVGSDEGCHWGNDQSPIGNWATYVAGANTDASGLTFVKLGINPIWQGSALYSTKPSFGLKVECPGGGCVGLPCSVDGDGVHSDLTSTGAGGSDFCVVTVPKGGKGNIVIYNSDGSTGDAESKTTSSTAAPQPTSTTASAEATTTSTSTSTSTSSSIVSTSSSAKPTSTSSTVSSTSSEESSTYLSSSSSSSSSSVHLGGIFQQNITETSSFSQVAPSTTSSPTAVTTSEGVASTESSKSESAAGAGQGNSAIVGLIVALVAAAYLF